VIGPGRRQLGERPEAPRDRAARDPRGARGLDVLHRIANQERARRRDPARAHEGEDTVGRRLRRHVVVAADDCAEEPGDPEPVENREGEAARLVREHRQRCPAFRQPAHDGFDPREEPRLPQQTLPVRPAERGERRLDEVGARRPAGGADAPLDQPADTAPDEAKDLLAPEPGQPDPGERGIRRRDQVAARVDERAVEVERDVRVTEAGRQTEKDDPQPQVRCAFGFTNLKPAPWSPST